MSKVLLISPPNDFLENPRSVPRLGLLYLATVLSQKGHEVEVRHMDNLNQARQLLDLDVDWVGISATTYEYYDALAIMNYFKRRGAKAKFILGGSHATALPTEAVRNGFDFVVTGEAEEVIELIISGQYRSRIVNAGYIADLNSIPIPDRDLAKEIFTAHVEGESLQTASILLSRGCPFACRFCGPHFRYRRRSGENIEQEIAYLKQMNVSELVIIDDLPFCNFQQVKEFTEMAKKHEINFRCNFRTDLISMKIVEILAESGCTRLQFGVESVTQRVLDQVEKKTNLNQNARAIALCKHFGIKSKAMFIWGLPQDDEQSACNILQWVKLHKPDYVQVSRFVPLPGSPLWFCGEGEKVVDYRERSFFDNKDENLIYQNLLDELAKYTTIDRGKTTREVKK